MKTALTEGVDYYIDKTGLMVFTEKYHRDRGYCCKSGCRHCPYGFKKNIVTTGLNKPAKETGKDNG
jgi:hypothetical protein